jgi:hypothetical protein
MFLNEKYFKKQPQSHSQTNQMILSILIKLKIYTKIYVT